MNQNPVVKKIVVVGLILLFLDVTLASSTIAIRGEDCRADENTQQRGIQTIPSSGSKGQPLFLTKFSAVGISSSNLDTFARGFRFTLAFEFTTMDSYVYIWFPKFSHSQWQEWNYTGPETFNAVLFFGSVENVDDKYIIQGRCLYLQIF